MEAFKKLASEEPKGLTNRYSAGILSVFWGISKGYIFEKRQARKPNSSSIKYNMVKLGHELGFRVYANGLKGEQLQEQRQKYGFANRELLFDIHWYMDKEGTHYLPEKIALVAESELGDRRKGDKSKQRNPAVMFDFQKLLAANAELRLMIFKTRNLSDLDALHNHFVKAINTYKLLRKGDTFLFVCFVHDKKEVYYFESVIL